jgi:prepilin-type N-terminal cleavage/methylation domain-containing protein
MRKVLKTIRESQKGFTLIEILVAVAIMGIIIGGLTTSISQVISVSASSANRESVIKQVESAVQFISRDAQQTQSATTTSGKFPVQFKWTSWTNVNYVVNYYLNGPVLMRSETIGNAPASVTRIADKIDTSAGMTTCSWAGGVFTLKITASTAGYQAASETRTVQVTARYGQ